MSWAWLAAGVLAQWGCIASLRASAGLRRPGWAASTYVTMVASLGCVSVAMSLGLSLAVAYGIWTGMGIFLAGVTGVVVFGDRLSVRQITGLGLVICGVVLLQAGTQV